jgi:hypothetical protein
MKRLKYLFLLALTAISFASCDTDAKMIELDAVGPIDASFSSTILSRGLKNTENNKFSVLVYRGNASSDAQVPVTITDASGLFTLATSNVSFTKGSYQATVDVNYTYTSLDPTKTYSITLNLDKNSLSPSAQGTMTCKVKMVLDWEVVGKGMYKSKFLDDYYGHPIEPYTVTLYKAKGLSDFYRLKDCYATDSPIDFRVKSDFTIDAAGFGTQSTGFVDSDYGLISATGISGSVSGKVYTFNLKFTVSAGSFGTFAEVFTLD